MADLLLQAPGTDYMQTNPEPTPRPAAWADQQLASLRERLPGWDAWYISTPFDPGSGYAWCARPSGAEVATCHGGVPDELAEAIAEFEADLAAHIETTREELDQTPGEAAGRRNLLDRQIAAMTRLQSRGQDAPDREIPK